jgi:hypothetical protein
VRKIGVVFKVMTKLAPMTADPKTKKHSSSHAPEQDPGLLQSKRSLAVRWNQIWNQMLQSHYHFKQTKWFPLVVLLQPLHGMFLEW